MCRPLQRLGVQGGDAEVAGIQARRNQGRRKAGAARAGTLTLEHHGPEALRLQRARHRCAGDTRADHGDTGRR